MTRSCLLCMLTICAIMLLSGPLDAVDYKPESANEHSDEEAVLDALNRYSSAFVRADYEAIGNIVRVPLVFVGNDTTDVITARSSVVAVYRAIRDALEEDNYETSVTESTNVVLLNEHIAQVELAYKRLDTSGKVFHRGKGHYIWRRIDGYWYLVGRIESGTDSPSLSSGE